MRALVIIAGIGIGLRLGLSIYGGYTIDMHAYMIDVQILRSGGNIYAEYIYYNYSPFWFFCLLFCSYLSEWTGLAFPLVVRAFLSIADTANGLLIYQIAERLRPGGGKFSFSAYMLNPAAALIVGLHGQFDALAMLPVLLAVHLQSQRRSTFRTWMLGTLAILIKQTTVFFVFTLFVFEARNWRRSIIMILCSGIVFLLSFTPFWDIAIIENVFLYQATPGDYGLTAILPRLAVNLLFFLTMILLPYLCRYGLHYSLPYGMLTTVLWFFVFAPGFYPHYLIILLIVGAVLADGWYAAFSIVSFDLLLLYYYGRSLPISLKTFVWPLIVAWGVTYLFKPILLPGLLLSGFPVPGGNGKPARRYAEETVVDRLPLQRRRTK